MMHSSSELSFPLEQFQHLPNPYYPHDALRDSLVRTNIVNLDLASPPPPQRTNPRSHPLTPPDTPGHRRINRIHTETDNQDDQGDINNEQGHLDAFLDLGLYVNKNNQATRYLVVGGVPPTASTALLSQVFSRMGALKGMFVRYQNKGVIVLSWHDLRDARKAHSVITANPLFNLDQPLSAAFITPLNLVKSTGESLFVNPSEGNLVITAEQPSTPKGRADGTSDGEQKQEEQPISLHAALALFGELSSFSSNEFVGSTTYFASYYDAREAENAKKSLHNRSILGMYIRVVEGFPQETLTEGQSQALGQKQHQPQGDNNSRAPSLQTRSPAATPERKSFNHTKRKAEKSAEPLSPSSLRHQQGTSDSDSEASTPRTPAQAQASRAQGQQDSPISQLPQAIPPSVNLHIRSNPNSRAFTKVANKAGTKVNISVNIPLYSTPPASSPRARTTSSGPVMMNPSVDPSNVLSSPHMLPRTIPPRLSLPWLHASMPGGPLHYERSVHGPPHFNVNEPFHHQQGHPKLGPEAYIHGLDTTPQPARHAPYVYRPQQHLGARPFVPRNSSTASSTGGTGNSTPAGESPTTTHATHYYPSTSIPKLAHPEYEYQHEYRYWRVDGRVNGIWAIYATPCVR
ncbi:hypothetical protein M408DRAFT_285651 [Serendipita vermifera MAFF 305830]|uniref:Uncharacterized protein n=1 Tax=Serendipita vermifera MAFF 305830 TaxID=933852 RepID=A0A0C3B0Z5_SERVB|nr:hypothetical protein M408DRAFT_285651 [Serendipita vermifera MAFF 305830]